MFARTKTVGYEDGWVLGKRTFSPSYYRYVSSSRDTCLQPVVQFYSLLLYYGPVIKSEVL